MSSVTNGLRKIRMQHSRRLGLQDTSQARIIGVEENADTPKTIKSISNKMDKVIIKSRYGASIVCCCASCRNKRYFSDKTDTRYCDIKKSEVLPSDFCSKYDMIPRLDNVGKGDGKIRKKSYLQYINENGGYTPQLEEEYNKIQFTKYLDF